MFQFNSLRPKPSFTPLLAFLKLLHLPERKHVMPTRNAGRTILFLALASSLTACGGGGGGVKTDPPQSPTIGPSPLSPAPPFQPAPLSPPPLQLPTPKCLAAGTGSAGADPACKARYTGPDDNILVPVNADLAQAAGFTGKNVKVGVLDDARIGGHAPLDGAIEWERKYFSDAAAARQNPGHGTTIATIAVGRPHEGFSGGVAPDARLYYAAVCDNDGCGIDRAGQAIADMGKEGVRIFNASFGGGGATDDGLNTALSTSYARFLRPLIATDGLLVASAGNSSTRHPGAIGGMPLVDPDFVGHVIVATAGVVDADGTVSELADYSNRCGFAAQWCVTAPGFVRQPALEGTAFQSGSRGTSNAAPIVTGAAALVLEAYPWMDARNLQQTLLTTATDIGLPGVDSVFGWGLLDARKAVSGPAQFQGFDFIADVRSGRSVFGNDIRGDRGITKKGAGTLELAGVNSFTGATVVAGGALVAPGGLGGSVEIHDGATLLAGGRIGGNFTAGKGATTAIMVGKPIEVVGTASLAGDVQLLAPAEGYSVHATEAVLSAGSVTGKFDSARSGSGFFYKALLSYSNTGVSAELARVSTTSMTLQSFSPERVVDGARQADALLDFVDTLPVGERAGLVSATDRFTDTQTAAESEFALASLTGEVHGTARAAAIQMSVSRTSLFGDRIATLNPADAGVWVQADTTDTEFARTDFAAAHVRSSSLVAGADRDIGNAVIGAALSNGRGWGQLDALGGRYDSDHKGASLYGRVPLASGYLTGSVGFARHDIDARRGVLLGGTMSSIDSKHEDDVWSVRVETGRSFGALQPFLAGGYIRHEQGPLRESGGEGLALVAGANTASIQFGELGLRFAHIVDRLTLRGMIGARWTGGDTHPSYTASFDAAPEVGFEIHGQHVPTGSARGSVGVEYRTAQNMVWNIGLAGESGTGDVTNVSATGGLRIIF